MTECIRHFARILCEVSRNKTFAKISEFTVSSMARGLSFGLGLYLNSYIRVVHANREDSGESAQMTFLIANLRSLLITPESSIQKGVK